MKRPRMVCEFVCLCKRIKAVSNYHGAFTPTHMQAPVLKWDFCFIVLLLCNLHYNPQNWPT